MQDQHPFHQWVEAARPRAQLWRTVVGLLLVAAVWFIWTLGLIFASIGGGVVDPDAFRVMFGMGNSPLGYTQTIAIVLVALATLWGFTIGVWATLKLLHKRRLSTLVAWNRRFSFSQFGIGCAIAAGYLAVSTACSIISGSPPRRSELEIGTWLIALGPIALVVFVQAASEELVFRGYLPQQLAARFNSPLVWGLLPSIVFGFMHAANSPGNQTYAIYYVVIATIMGMVMLAMVWRTGSLAAAIGFHFINNVGALTLAGADSGSSSMALFVWTPDQLTHGASIELLLVGGVLAFVLSPWAPLPKGQALARRNETRAAP
jgi:membrane protease YdiL (CAAX protease family)